MQSDTPFKLGQFTVNPREYLIEASDDKKNSLQPKFIEVLVYLATKYPHLVGRRELIENVWDGNHYVGEKALTNAIWNLRQELKQGDDQLIETVRKIGYRLSIKPEFLSQENKPDEQPVEQFQLSQLLNWKRFSLVLFPVFVIAFSIFYFVHALQGNAPVKISSVTTEPGREVFPAVSPDGRYIVYATRLISRKFDLHLKDLSQPDLLPRQLTFSSEGEGRPVWGAKGEKIYYVRKSWDYTRCEVMQMTLVTAEQKVIGLCPGHENFSISISGDGKVLAYTGISEGYSKSGIYFLDLSNPEAKPQRFSCGNECTYSDRDFAFSPDGKFIAVTRREESLVEDIFLVELQTRESRQLTFGQGDIRGLAWHPDGKRIVFGSENFGAREGYVISLDDNKITQLNIPGFSYPSFFPNSHEVVFHSWQVLSHISYLSLLEVVAATPFPLVQSEFNHGSPHYSQRANRLVYVSNESGYNEIWSSAVDGSQRKKLTNMKTNLSSPRWSYDGESVAFLGPKKERLGDNLYVLNVKTRSIKKLVSPFNEHYRPSWRRDDSAVIAAASQNNESKLYVFSLDGSNPKSLGNSSAVFAIQATDNSVWFTKGRNQGLWRFNPEKPDDEAERVLSGEQFGVRYNWTITERGLYYQFDQIDHHRINYYDFNSKKVTPLVKFPTRTLDRFGSITYIPEEEKIVFTRSEYPQVDIKRLDHPILH
ncbi:winged helix-turn-helix domain-containing protein [Aliikangiella coralliicola]|uniref:Transcriptional regulator n=1 Tax=Aliikangiella coralliicola TaxID=2592383 RepID=A0A545U650_9GAMM|nr:winged helix-turn-helix domain-containing protein [Aliikangiella coralliicola]TQV84955.1 transcriptional regulator [Aliikangiella coralliicola]